MEIIKTYKQKAPALRFIGKKYGDEDRVDGGFGKQWGEAFAPGGLIATVEALSDGTLFEDAGAYIGLMRCKDGEPFLYAIGMFCPAGTEVPEGYWFNDFPQSVWGIGWIYGNEASGELYCHEPEVAILLEEEGHPIVNDAEGACWFFERYACPRYTTPDVRGNVILDIGFFVGEE